LICSSVSMVKAYAAIQDGKKYFLRPVPGKLLRDGGLKFWLLVTMICGAAFVSVQVVEYIKLVGHGFTPAGFREGSLLAEHAASALMTTPSPATTAHTRPNYILIWLYLFVMTVAEVALAFELPFSRNVKLLMLLVLAIIKALLVALFFMHLKFERWRLRLIFIVPLPLAAILVTAVIMEKV